MSAVCWGPDTDLGKGWSLLKIHKNKCGETATEQKGFRTMDHAKGSRPLSTKVSDEATCVATTAANKLLCPYGEEGGVICHSHWVHKRKLVSLREGITSKKWFLILNLRD